VTNQHELIGAIITSSYCDSDNKDTHFFIITGFVNYSWVSVSGNEMKTFEIFNLTNNTKGTFTLTFEECEILIKEKELIMGTLLFTLESTNNTTEN